MGNVRIKEEEEEEEEEEEGTVEEEGLQNQSWLPLAAQRHRRGLQEPNSHREAPALASDHNPQLTAVPPLCLYAATPSLR